MDGFIDVCKDGCIDGCMYKVVLPKFFSIRLFCKAKFQLLINARRKLNAQFFATCLDWRRQARESSLATHIYIVVNCEMMLIMFLSDCFTSAYVGCAGAFHVQGFSLHLEEHCPSRCHCHRCSTTASTVSG